MASALRVEQLEVTAGNNAPAIVGGVSFTVPRGEVLALIGESGSGKTTLALALMGFTRAGCRIRGGTILLGDTAVLSLSPAELRALRGCRISYVAQSAAAAFNPALRLMDQIVEAAVQQRVYTRAQAEQRVLELLRAMALPEPDAMGQRYPHQLSGGQLQRVLAAMALLAEPELVIFDEPTTALDVTTQLEVLRLFKQIIRERSITAVYVSHDLAVVAQMADRILVLRGGLMVECGPTARLLASPTHEYTQSLVAAVHPARRPAAPPAAGLATAPPAAPLAAAEPLLAVSELCARYDAPASRRAASRPVLSNLTVAVKRGELLGVIGESGSGKSTLARVIAGLVPPAAGELRFAGNALSATLGGRTVAQFRAIQIVFQNADTALNPMHTVERVLARPLALFGRLPKSQRRARVDELLELVQLPRELARRTCAELSGGQKQRINLARALAAEPDLLVCDEITSALDTVVGAAILQLIADLRTRLGLTALFISHDLNAVRALCDRVLVLYAGQAMEIDGEARLQAPMHPYTELLAASVPELRPDWLESAAARTATPMTQPPARAPATGAAAFCPFVTRCVHALPGVCECEPAPLRESSRKQLWCHRTMPELSALQSRAELT